MGACSSRERKDVTLLADTELRSDGPLTVPRAKLTAVEAGFMLLMPISGLATWALLAAAYLEVLPLAPVVFGTALFQTAWALRNRFYAGNRRELGMLTYGILALGAALTLSFEGAWPYYVALTGCFLVAASVAYVLSLITCWPLVKLALLQKKTTCWAGVLKVYLWSMLLQMVGVGYMMVLALIEAGHAPPKFLGLFG